MKRSLICIKFKILVSVKDSIFILKLFKMKTSFNKMSFQMLGQSSTFQKIFLGVVI